MNISNDVSEHTNYEIKSKCMLLRFDEIVTSLVPVSSGKSDYTLSFMDTEKTMDEFCICIYSRSCNHQNIISIHQNLYQSCHQSTNITSAWKKKPVCVLFIGLNLFFLEWLYINGYWFNLYTKLLTNSEQSEFLDYPCLVADSDSYISNARGG